MQSQHYAGVAFDVAQNLNSTQRAYMRNLAVSSGIWNYVEPISLTPRWVHFDERTTVSGYPIINRGSKGVYVLIAQDSLNTLGYATGGLDGVFGARTDNAVRRFQENSGLVVDGVVGKNTWNILMNRVVGNGATGTTIN